MSWRVLMKITVLSENTKRKDELKSEHGLSLLLERDDNKVLFDTGGPEGSAFQNAETLNFDISKVNAVVISHAHYDHSGGLLNFFKINDTAPVYLKKESLDPYYAKRISKREFIGIDSRIIKNYYERFKFVDKTLEILDGVFIIPQILKKFTIPSSNRYLFSLKDDQLVRDQFNHEIFMAVQNNEMMVFSGCGHNGIRNIIYTAEKIFPNKKIRTIIGGFHFQAGKSTALKAKDEEILETANWLKSEGLEKIYTGHCTGSQGFKIMQTVLGSDLIKIYTGQKILI